MVSLLNDFVCVLSISFSPENTSHIHCTGICCYEYSYAVSSTFEQKNISYIQYKNTSCHCVFHCVVLVHVQLQTLYHNLCAHVVLSCCHSQVQWYLFRSLFRLRFHLQKKCTIAQYTGLRTNIVSVRLLRDDKTCDEKSNEKNHDIRKDENIKISWQVSSLIHLTYLTMLINNYLLFTLCCMSWISIL